MEEQIEKEIVKGIENVGSAINNLFLDSIEFTISNKKYRIFIEELNLKKWI